MSIIDPTKNTSLIIDDFISYATQHLTTVSGIANTISLYPTVPTPTPAPGVVNWTGYTVPPAQPTPSFETSISEVQLSEEQLAIANLASIEGLSISEATARAFEYKSRGVPPPVSFAESEQLFEASLSQGPIKEPTKEELESEGAATGDIPQGNIQPIPNYKTNIKVPDDIILAMRRWGVGKDNPKERAHFLSQCAHESGGFKLKIENLNYSSAGLLGVFPKYFKSQSDAESYARKPELIASKVYGNRMGNGTEQSKEGWKYRGRGYIQLTGKSNYINAEKVIKGGIVNTPDLVEKIYPGDSACFFWTSTNLKRHISSDNDLSIKKLTKSINGGDKGLEDRKKKFVLYWNELQKDPSLWA